jgi:beta-phosphoglucomutase
MADPGLTKGAIFDLDGVLVSTDELHYQAWKQLADIEAIYFDRRINQRLRGVGRLESLEIILERSARVYTDAEKAELADRKNRTYQELLQSLGPQDVLPGAKEMIAELRGLGIKLAVASSSKNAHTILQRVGLVEAFDTAIGGHDIRRSKPDPEIFLLAARRLGLPPDRCLVVEDAAAGIEAARRAGMAFFGIGTPQTLPGVEHLAGSLAQVSVKELLAAMR